MKKINLAIIFGGKSTENEVSVLSALSVLDNINKDKYNITSIYINKNGKWENYNTKEKINNIIQVLEKMDVIFPIMHGLYGEDGTIQGLFEIIGKPYVGCHVLASSIGMDKAYTKIIFEKAGLKQAKYIYLKSKNDKYFFVNESFDEIELSLDKICEKIIDKLKFPIFIKPSNSGSSIGINKANNVEELKKYIEIAKFYDKKIIIEENINGRELECSVLGNENVIASVIGEIIPADEFYSYNAKYNNEKSITKIASNLDKKIEEKIKESAIKAFKAIDGKGLARVDFFLEEKTNDIYINEINTLPGFTKISMYPKLFEYSGIKYSDLIDKIIELALE